MTDAPDKPMLDLSAPDIWALMHVRDMSIEALSAFVGDPVPHCEQFLAGRAALSIDGRELIRCMLRPPDAAAPTHNWACFLDLLLRLAPQDHLVRELIAIVRDELALRDRLGSAAGEAWVGCFDPPNCFASTTELEQFLVRARDYPIGVPMFRDAIYETRIELAHRKVWGDYE
jgi:hypothetical protein